MRASPKREHWHPPTYEKADIRAIQALARGDATESDQRRALDWIINVAAATYDEPFRPGQGDAVTYMLGRRSVGLALVKLMKIKPDLLDQ
jgi:hypothetical protein